MAARPDQDFAPKPASRARTIVVANLFALNLTQAAFFRKYGFFAAILVRVAFYLIWHALYIH